MSHSIGNTTITSANRLGGQGRPSHNADANSQTAPTALLIHYHTPTDVKRPPKKDQTLTTPS